MTNLTEAEYFAYRSSLLQNPQFIIDAEKKYMDFLVSVTLSTADELYVDFQQANDLLPFWRNYPPKQRGRQPTGTSTPWSEVGEKSLSSNLLREIGRQTPKVTFPGLPFGGDVRFATDDALIHFDVKMTGPNDRTDEVVAPPQQISGDGSVWDNGIRNGSFLVQGQRASMQFYPKLPPFYEMAGSVRLCLTYFLKSVYSVHADGVQPLAYLEVACVPNGLLLMHGSTYCKITGLFIPGKDDQSVAPSDKRTRVRLNPLASIDDGWRCQKIVPKSLPFIPGVTGWRTVKRL